MSEITENERTIADLSARVAKLEGKLLDYAATSYAYNKINNVLLMQVLSTTENRDMEEIRVNVERYIADITSEYVKGNS
jgi:hypothetical protein